MKRITLIALALSALAPVGLAGSYASGTPSEALLQATPRWGEIRAVTGDSAWWPELPQLNGRLEPGSKALSLVVQRYRRTDGSAALEAALSLFPSEKAAKSDYSGLRAKRDAGGQPLAGPAVASERRYFTREADNGRETTLRFRFGNVVGRISAFAETQSNTATLARLVRPVLQRLTKLAAGRLRAPSIPGSLSALLPPAASAPGQVVGTVLIPAESWALADTSGNPLATKAKLVSLGSRQLVLRRYLLSGTAGHVVEVVLFPFSTAAGASSWVSSFQRLAAAKGALDAGKTGGQSAFTSYGGSFYELQFARGRYVGDVSCFAPFARVSRACEAATRSLAEAWFAALPG